MATVPPRPARPRPRAPGPGRRAIPPRTAARTRARTPRSASFRPPSRPGGGPRPRSTGSRTAPAAPPRAPRPPARSHQQPFVGAAGPGGELLAVGPVAEVVAQDPLDVVGQAIRAHLQPAQLTAERRVGPERAAQVYLEPLAAVHGRALKPDVGDLEPGAGVGAAVDVDADRGVEAGQPPLQLPVQVGGPLLGLHDRQLAELDPGAGHRAAPERRRG